jgi:alkylation response protein AidB-like acyl-CoA dehydrogenase
MIPILTFLKTHFNKVDQQKPYSEGVLNDFLALGPLHYFIPKTLGGQGDGPSSYLKLVENVSYYSLPLGLTLGITGSLFLLPFVKHASSALRGPVIQDFLTSPALGGMMITEPDGGTDVFGLSSRYTRKDDTLTLNGTKCWGGLTGRAGHWLVAARLQRGETLTKKLHLLYIPSASSGIEVEDYFDALGLQPITYGVTRYCNTEIPETHIMGPARQNGLRIIYDTLFRSRLGMSAITAGVCRRLVDEVAQRVSQRRTFGQCLSGYDQVQFRLSGLQHLHTINQQLLRHAQKYIIDRDDISGDYTLVNAVKVISSETLQAAADSSLQLFAAAGYKQNHLVGRAFVDARPFQIFEGSNDVLYENIYDVILGRHRGFNLDAIACELQRYDLAMARNIPAAAQDLFDSPGECTQREKVLYGQIVAWVFTLSILQDSVADRTEALDQADFFVQSRIAALAASFPYCQGPLPLAAHHAMPVHC